MEDRHPKMLTGFFKESTITATSARFAHFSSGRSLVDFPITGIIGDGDMAQLAQRRTSTPLTQVRFPGAERNFSPPSQLSVQTLLGCLRTPRVQSQAFYVCAHVEDPVVQVRVRRIMKTPKHPACTVGWVARLWHSWLSPNFSREKSQWDSTVVKKRKETN